MDKGSLSYFSRTHLDSAKPVAHLADVTTQSQPDALAYACSSRASSERANDVAAAPVGPAEN